MEVTLRILGGTYLLSTPGLASNEPDTSCAKGSE